MKLYFCPSCRRAASAQEICQTCNVVFDSPALDYIERLLETILSDDTDRASMAVDVLTKWLREPRSITPLVMLLHTADDPYRLVLAARGLGWLSDPQAVSELGELLLDEDKPFVARIAAAEALGAIGGEIACQSLEQAARSLRPSVASASGRALERIRQR